MQDRETLQSLLDEVDSLIWQSRESSQFQTRHKKTIRYLERVFWDNSWHLRDFKDIYFGQNEIDFIPYQDSSFIWWWKTIYDTKEEWCEKGLNYAKPLLLSYIDEVPVDDDIQEVDSIWILENLFQSFHTVARKLRKRHWSRGTIDI